jgi:hypothetical protein
MASEHSACIKFMRALCAEGKRSSEIIRLTAREYNLPKEAVKSRLRRADFARSRSAPHQLLTDDQERKLLVTLLAFNAINMPMSPKDLRSLIRLALDRNVGTKWPYRWLERHAAVVGARKSSDPNQKQLEVTSNDSSNHDIDNPATNDINANSSNSNHYETPHHHHHHHHHHHQHHQQRDEHITASHCSDTSLTFQRALESAQLIMPNDASNVVYIDQSCVNLCQSGAIDIVARDHHPPTDTAHNNTTRHRTPLCSIVSFVTAQGIELMSVYILPAHRMIESFIPNKLHAVEMLLTDTTTTTSDTTTCTTTTTTTMTTTTTKTKTPTTTATVTATRDNTTTATTSTNDINHARPNKQFWAFSNGAINSELWCNIIRLFIDTWHELHSNKHVFLFSEQFTWHAHLPLIAQAVQQQVYMWPLPKLCCRWLQQLDVEAFSDLKQHIGARYIEHDLVGSMFGSHHTRDCLFACIRKAKASTAFNPTAIQAQFQKADLYPHNLSSMAQVLEAPGIRRVATQDLRGSFAIADAKLTDATGTEQLQPLDYPDSTTPPDDASCLNHKRKHQDMQHHDEQRSNKRPKRTSTT